MGVNSNKKRSVILFILFAYIWGGFYLMFTPGYSPYVTKMYYIRKLPQIETFINYIEENRIDLLANENYCCVVVKSDRIEFCSGKGDFVYSIHDILSAECQDSLRQIGITVEQLNTIVSNFRNMGMEQVFISRSNYQYLLQLFRSQAYCVMSKAYRDEGKVYNPLDDTEMGSRMEPVRDRNNLFVSILVSYLYPYFFHG